MEDFDQSLLMQKDADAPSEGITLENVQDTLQATNSAASDGQNTLVDNMKTDEVQNLDLPQDNTSDMQSLAETDNSQPSAETMSSGDTAAPDSQQQPGDDTQAGATQLFIQQLESGAQVLFQQTATGENVVIHQSQPGEQIIVQQTDQGHQVYVQKIQQNAAPEEQALQQQQLEQQTEQQQGENTADLQQMLQQGGGADLAGDETDVPTTAAVPATAASPTTTDAPAPAATQASTTVENGEITSLKESADVKNTADEFDEAAFMSGLNRCSDAINLVYKSDELLVSRDVITVQEFSMMKVERFLMDMTSECAGIHYHLCCSDGDGAVAVRYYESGKFRGFLNEMLREIKTAYPEIDPIGYRIATDSDIEKHKSIVTAIEATKTSTSPAETPDQKFKSTLSNLDESWSKYELALGFSELNIYSLMIVIAKTQNTGQSFLKAFGHKKERIEELINAYQPPESWTEPDLQLTAVPESPSLEEQMQYLCSLSNSHYGTTTRYFTYQRNLAVLLANDKKQPVSIRNRIIMGFAEKNAKNLKSAVEFFNVCQKKLLQKVDQEKSLNTESVAGTQGL